MHLHEARHNAAWMELHGFKRKCTHSSTWPASDIEKLRAGLRRVGEGKDLFCNMSQDPGAWLAHYVMEDTYAPRECVRMARRLMRAFAVDLAQVPEIQSVSRDVRDGAASDDGEEGGSASDSDSEEEAASDGGEGSDVEDDSDDEQPIAVISAK